MAAGVRHEFGPLRRHLQGLGVRVRDELVAGAVEDQDGSIQRLQRRLGVEGRPPAERVVRLALPAREFADLRAAGGGRYLYSPYEDLCSAP